MQNHRKIKIFYSDDRSDNVKSLLDAIQNSNIIYSRSDSSSNQLKTFLPENNYNYNKAILDSDDCLINLDYSTKIDGSIEKLRTDKNNYDLVICDLFYGEFDKKYAKSSVGGIWIIFWAMHLTKNKRIVCKLYTGQLEKVRNEIDYIKAIEFTRDAYGVEIDVIDKSHDAKSWREHLVNYLSDVRKNIIPEIKFESRIDFLNYISTHLKYDTFHNFKEANRLDEFYKYLSEIETIFFPLDDGRVIKLIHLFPFLLGSHFTTDDTENFKNMSHDQLQNCLYKQKFFYENRGEREAELEKYQIEEIECKAIREFDETNRPIYGIKFKPGNSKLDIISQIENSFIESLDWTYKIHNFFTRHHGFGYWMNTTPTSPYGDDKYNSIRTDSIIPAFLEIKECFRIPTSKDNINKKLADQIELSIRNVSEQQMWEWKKYKEQNIEHGFKKLENRNLIDEQNGEIILTLASLFRINISNFLRKVLKIKEGNDYSTVTKNGFSKIGDNKFNWYCNAWLIREGLKYIFNEIMDSETNKEFFLLEEGTEKSFIKYKIILRDYDQGIPSIVRKYYNDTQIRCNFEHYFMDFCQFTIRSKVKGYPGTALALFTNRDEIECDDMTTTGTEYEMMFTQRREE